MRKCNKVITLFLALIMLFSTAAIGFAEENNFEEREIETGFYIKSGEKNLFIDIYTFLNKGYEETITDAELKNALFVHQSGKGATLSDILEKGNVEEAIDFLEPKDFETQYMDVGDDNKPFKPKISDYTLDVRLNRAKYTLDDQVKVFGEVAFRGIGVENVDITMKLGETDIITVDQVKTDKNGEFEIAFTLPEEITLGKHTLTVKANEPVNRYTELELEVIEDEIPAEIIGQIAAKMTDLYKHIDEKDKPAIRDARENLNNLSEEAWTSLLTSEVIAKFESEDAAKAVIESAIKDLSELYYSADSEELENRLTTLAEKHLPTYRTVFGYDETAEELLNFLKVLIENIPNGITPSIGNELIEANDTRLLELIDDIAKNTLSNTLKQEEYAKFNGKLSEVGLSVDTLLNVRKNIAEEIDSEGKAQIAMIMAYTRMNTVVEGPAEVIVGGTAEYTLTVLGKEVSTLANWASSNEEVATISINEDDKVVLTPVAEGTTTIIVYRGENEANWIAKFEVVVGAGEEPDPTPTPVAEGKITETSTKIEGVDVEYKDGLLTISIDENIDWTKIVQDPNVELGADADVLYVGIHLERPNEEITHVMINDGKEDKIVELGKHEATTETGRFYYFGVAKKVTEGEGENVTVTWETITDEEAKTRTVKWYAIEEEKEALKAIETFNVKRVLKEEEGPITADVKIDNGKIIINGTVALEEGQKIDSVSVLVYQGENIPVINDDLTEIDEFLDGIFSFQLEIPEDLESGEYTVEVQVLLEGSDEPLVFTTTITLQ